MSSDLKILPVKDLKDDKNNKKTNFKLNPILMGADKKGNFKPFCALFVAPPRSGKTNMINNLLYSEWFGYKNIFDQIILFSPTIANDTSSGRFIMEDPDITVISENLDQVDDYIEALADIQKEAEPDEREQILIILDDMLGLLPKKGFLDNLASKYRHYRISLIITTQNFRSIGTTLRYCANYYVIWKTHNKKEKEKIIEELSGNFENFETLMEVATDKRYEFLYLDLEKIKAYCCFHTLLWSKD